MSKNFKNHKELRLQNLLWIAALFTLRSLSASTTENPSAIHPLFEGIAVPEGIHVATAENEQVNLSEKLEANASVLVFYRGGWCPYCNQHLSDLAAIESQLLKLGYQVIAVSADSPESLHSFTEENPFAYELYSDAEREASNAFGLTFRVDDKTYKKYKRWGLDLEEASGNDSHELPVPGVFVIKGGVIQFAYVNPDYKIRLHGDVLLSAAKAAMEE